MSQDTGRRANGAVLALARAADGLRVRDLGDLLSADIPARRPLLGSWLTDHHLNMTYAAAGVGKSMFALTIALAVAGGGGAFGWEGHDPRRVLYVDGEMDVIDLRDRAKVLLAALPEVDRRRACENLRMLAYQDQSADTEFPDLATVEGRDKIIAMVRADKTTLVILDNFSTLCTVEDENSASSFDPMIDLMRRLKQHGCAVMLIHHARKSSSGTGSSYRGTSKMAVIFDTIIALEHPGGLPSTEGTAFSLRWEKMRQMRDGTIVPLTARLNANAESGPKWECDVTQGTLTARLVALVLSCEYPSQKALAEALGVSEGQLSKLKVKAISDNLISSAKWAECMKLANEVAEAGGPTSPYGDFTADLGDGPIGSL